MTASVPDAALKIPPPADPAELPDRVPSWIVAVPALWLPPRSLAELFEKAPRPRAVS
ncbi:MAG TPA: hypothetical protein VJ739_05310 [Gemmataceae bacterium]|nr:hypothetical protein [Gemmataceae bacterium]